MIRNRNIKIFITVLIGFSFISLGEVLAQKEFVTKKGDVIATSKHLDTIITAKSSDLLVQLDYENAAVKMTFDLNTFRTGIDSLDEQIKSVKPNELYFDGKLGLEFISTYSHLTQYFDFNGNLYTNSIKTFITGNGRLEHVSEKNAIAACVLWLTFRLDVKEMDWDLKSYGVDENIQVEIIQAVLKKNQ